RRTALRRALAGGGARRTRTAARRRQQHLVGCSSLPSGLELAPSRALDDTTGTRLGRSLAPAVAANPGKSGIHALADGRDAFAARILLARAAERSLDLQYYIYRNDITG